MIKWTLASDVNIGTPVTRFVTIPSQLSYKQSGVFLNTLQYHALSQEIDCEIIRLPKETHYFLGMRTASTIATRKSAGMSPIKLALSVESRSACTSMIAACAAEDHTTNQMKLLCSPGFLAAKA